MLITLIAFILCKAFKWNPLFVFVFSIPLSLVTSIGASTSIDTGEVNSGLVVINSLSGVISIIVCFYLVNVLFWIIKILKGKLSSNSNITEVID